MMILPPSSSFDVELPYECDDEYWQTGSQATDFVQPLNRRPSQLTAFILTLQLHKIFSTILREIVCLPIPSPFEHG